MNDADWLIVDWGTTNFRAFAVGKSGEILSKIERPMGLLQVESGKFAAALESVLKSWIYNYEALPVFMAGMVGSSQGWITVPYEKTPVLLTEVAKKSTKFMLPWGAEATIVPGIYEELDNGAYDVMRGEEVQLLGLQSLTSEHDFIAVLPGTHSKHVSVQNCQIASFKTFMTGEFFSILSKYSIIGMGLPNQNKSRNSFIKGVSNELGSELMNVIFSARTLRIFNKIKENEVLEYLSGVLIGNELKNLEVRSVYIVGNSSLSEKYKTACESLGLKCKIFDGELAFLEGMKKIRASLKYE